MLDRDSRATFLSVTGVGESYNILTHPNQGNKMVTLSIDYRSPPSGLGQIIHPNGDMELIHYSGCSMNNWPYTDDHYFNSDLQSVEDWTPIFQLLRDKGVEKVYDSEMSYDEEGFDEDQMISLENWISIVTDRLSY